MAGWTEQMIPTASGVEIETRFNGKITICNRIALIAHPWGRLGGSLNDHVVQSLASCLIEKHGYSVVLMNSRGVGRSAGSASLTGIPEAEDYQSIARKYLEQGRAVQEVLYCGYSAGALSASHCESGSLASIKSRYVLISYPLSVLWALTAFRSSVFASRLETLCQNKNVSVLSIRGSQDQFTGDHAYNKWEALLQQQAQNTKFVRVEGADHFWSSRTQMASLLSEVSTWLKSGGDADS